MASEKIIVDQERIKKLLKQSVKCYSISKLLHIPITVPEAIQAGRDRPYYKKRPKRAGKDICEKCGINEKHPGFQKLCYRCWKENPESSKAEI